MYALNGLGLAAVGIFTANAAWLAPPPRGYMKLIAQRGTGQQYLAGAFQSECSAARIEKPVHDFVENTITGLQQANRLGAKIVQIDLRPTADGRFVLLRDDQLDCRTEGSGLVSKTALADVQKLDPGYGYTPDGGRSWPMRALPTSRIPSLEEALRSLPSNPILFTLHGKDPAEGERLAAALKAAGRDVAKRGDGFTGDEAAISPLREAFPKAWAFSPQSAAECASRYRLIGWLTMVPDACKGGAILVPIGSQWTFPGWPDRMIARLGKANVRIILTAPPRSDGEMAGLDLPEQLSEVPFNYTGHVLIGDIWTMGPVFHPAANRRAAEQQNDLVDALAARRKARGLPEPK